MDNREEEREKFAESLYRYIGYCRSEQIAQTDTSLKREHYPIAIDKWFFLYRKALNKKHRQHIWLMNGGRKVAVAALVVLAVFCGAVFSVDAFRVSVLNFIFDKNDVFTSVKVMDAVEGVKETIPSSWVNAYVPLYIPNTYELALAQDAGVIKTIVYRNNAGDELFFSQGDRNSNFQVDTEDASSEEFQIAGVRGLLVTKKRWNTLLWYTNESAFCVVGVLPVDELLRFSESIEVSKQ